MSLANNWADGEDSIAAPRSHRRSAERDVDAKDQFHTNSQKKGRQSRYDDADATNMAAAGYVNNDHDDNRDGPRRGNNYYGSSSRSAGRDSRPKMEWRRRRDQPPPSAELMLDGGAQGIPTSTKMECEDLLISLLSAGNSFALVEHFRRGCNQSSRWQVR
jgi:hypothetical protein